MKQPDTLNFVAEFHNTFKHPVLSEPTIPSEDRCKLRVAVLAEELKELEEALEKKDIVGVADALCDLQYVLSGAVLEFGLGDKFKELFQEVHRSNMTKACNTSDEARRTMESYLRKGTQCYFLNSGEKFLIYRTGDNKTLKSINYSPADLKSIIEKL